jgi:hypothetical protein
MNLDDTCGGLDAQTDSGPSTMGACGEPRRHPGVAHRSLCPDGLRLVDHGSLR